MEQLGELAKVADAFGYVEQQHQPGAERRERNDMTEPEVKKLIREKLVEALAKARTTGGVSTMKDHFKNAASYHKKQAKTNTAISDAHNELARAAEARGDFGSAKSYRASADGHLAMTQAHQAHAEQLSTMANGGPDVWGLAAATINSEGKPVNEKVAKSITTDFFDQLYRAAPTPPQSASGGLFE